MRNSRSKAMPHTAHSRKSFHANPEPDSVGFSGLAFESVRMIVTVRTSSERENRIFADWVNRLAFKYQTTANGKLKPCERHGKLSNKARKRHLIAWQNNPQFRGMTYRPPCEYYSQSYILWGAVAAFDALRKLPCILDIHDRADAYIMSASGGLGNGEKPPKRKPKYKVSGAVELIADLNTESGIPQNRPQRPKKASGKGDLRELSGGKTIADEMPLCGLGAYSELATGRTITNTR